MHFSSKEVNNIVFAKTLRDYVGTCFITSYSNLFVRRPFRTTFAEQVGERCQLYPRYVCASEGAVLGSDLHVIFHFRLNITVCYLHLEGLRLNAGLQIRECEAAL